MEQQTNGNNLYLKNERSNNQKQHNKNNQNIKKNAKPER